MKKQILALLMTVILLCTACTEEKHNTQDVNGEFQVYYLNIDFNEIIPCDYTMKADTLEKMVEECIEELSHSTDGSVYVAPISSNLELKEYTLSNGQLSMNFGENYLTLNDIKEVLIRAAIVKTLVQIPGVESITFYVEGAPLRDAKDNVVGVMSKDSFVNNVGEPINSLENYEITLYYASKDGATLVAEKSNVYAATNVSMEKLVLTYLMKAPKNSELQSVIPADTKLISVATLDGVCFVNFDEKFLEYNYQVAEEVAFYSIVNTLCEVTGVNKVQISVNGATDIVFRDKYSLDKLYERNLDCVQKEELN